MENMRENLCEKADWNVCGTPSKVAVTQTMVATGATLEVAGADHEVETLSTAASAMFGRATIMIAACNREDQIIARY